MLNFHIKYVIMLKTKMKKQNYYIDDSEFLKLLVDYHNRKKENPNHTCPNDLAKYFLLVSRHMANRWNFSNYTYKEDMISEGVITCLKYMDNFNPDLVIIKKDKTKICELTKEEYQLRKDEFPSNIYKIIICTPFNYFSQLVFRAFQQILNVEKKHRTIRTDYEDKITFDDLFVRIKNGVKTYREFNKAISIEPEVTDNKIAQPDRILGWEQEIPVNEQLSNLLCLFQDEE